MNVFFTKITALLLSAPPALGAVHGAPDRKSVGLGEVFTYQLTVEAEGVGNVDEPRFPEVPGLEFIGASTSMQTRSLFSNGRFITKQSRSFIYQLVAQRKGRITIPAIPVKVDGFVQRTDPADVTVGDAAAGGGGGQVARPQRGRRPPDPFGAMDQMDEMEQMFNQMLQRNLGRAIPRPGGDPRAAEDAFFIQATTDKTHAYVGEQITTNFYLVARGQVRDIDTLRYPDLKGFWKEDLEMATRLNFEPVTLNGEPWQRALLVSYALFPIRAGKTTIDGYKAKCSVLTPSAFGFGRAAQFTKSSTPIAIEVSEVPQPRPADFTGAVGHFRLTAQFEPSVGSVGQPVTLRVRIEGKGNAKLIELPKLNLPEGLEIFETKSQAKFVRDGSSFKEFEVLILPRRPGRFSVGEVTTSSFDPEQKSFTKLASPPLELTVTGQVAPNVAEPTLPDLPATPAADAGPVVPELAGERGRPPGDGSVLMILNAIVYGGCLLALGLALSRHLRRRPRKASLAAVVKRRVETSRALVLKKEWRPAGVELTNTVYHILGQISERGGASLDLDRLLEHTPPSLRNELAQPLRDLLSRCEALSFAPAGVLESLSGRAEIDQLFVDFERIVNRAIALAEI